MTEESCTFFFFSFFFFFILLMLPFLVAPGIHHGFIYLFVYLFSSWLIYIYTSSCEFIILVDIFIFI